MLNSLAVRLGFLRGPDDGVARAWARLPRGWVLVGAALAAWVVLGLVGLGAWMLIAAVWPG